jgi:outer membrane autotransporter protein
VRRNNTASTSLRTGLQAAKVTKVARKQTRLTASLDWIQSLDSDTAHADITLAGAGAAPSRFQGSRTGSSGVRAGLGAEVATTERTRLRLNVDQQRRSGVNSTFGSISFSLQL